MPKISDTIHHRCVGGEKIKLWYYHITVAAITVLLISLIPVTVSANSGMTVTNAAIIDTVSPGQILTQTMVVSMGDSDPITDVSVSVDGIAQSSSGGAILLANTQDISQDTARQWVTVDKSSFQLEPGQSENITATITVPQDVSSGAYFAMINIAKPPVATNGTNVAIVYSVNVPIYLTIAGSQLIQTGKIRGVTTGDIANGQSIDINTTFQNIGNTYFKVEGEVTVTNGQGLTLDIIPIPLIGNSILPGMSRDLDATYTPSGSLSPGTYTVNAQVILSDGTVLDQSTGTFTIKAPYVPPPALGNVSLSLSGASTLQSTDGTISIYFPVGAAAVPVALALNNIAATQLPAATTGFTLTGSAFNIEGLTGLLAKNATVTVKYTADDLSKANGKASSLLLMRWDAGTNQWTIPGTKVDAKAMTLSAKSNRMGIWAVAVDTVASSGTNWTIIGIPIAVLIVIAIVAILLITRSKRKQKSRKDQLR
jgi:hypothetical protein